MSPSGLPAILGGTPVRPQGPPAWPPPDPDVLEALHQAYREGAWGKYHGAFEDRLVAALRDLHQSEHVVLCGSGTYAVELALRALRIEAGDEVLLAAYDFPGNFLNIHAVGALPVLVDIHPGNWNLAVSQVEAALRAETKAIIASHLHGGVVPMRDLMDLARARGLSVIEDAAQMPGALVQGRCAGTWGDIGILSFGGSKLLGAGRGGALVTAHAAVYQRARTIAFRGNLVSPLSELQAAVLLPQLSKLEARNHLRLDNVKTLTRLLANVPGLRPLQNPADPDTRPGYYKLGFQFDAAAFGLDRVHFVKAMRAEGIALDEGFAAQHVGRSPRRFRRGTALTESDRAHEGSIILHHPVLLGSDADLAEVAQAVAKIRAHAVAARS